MEQTRKSLSNSDCSSEVLLAPSQHRSARPPASETTRLQSSSFSTSLMIATAAKATLTCVPSPQHVLPAAVGVVSQGGVLLLSRVICPVPPCLFLGGVLLGPLLDYGPVLSFLAAALAAAFGDPSSWPCPWLPRWAA